MKIFLLVALYFPCSFVVGAAVGRWLRYIREHSNMDLK